MAEVATEGNTGGGEFRLEDALKILRTFYGLEEASGGLSIKKLDSFIDDNFLIQISGLSTTDIHRSGFPEKMVLKVYSYGSPEKRLQAVGDVLLHVESCGIKCSRPLRNLQGDVLTRVVQGTSHSSSPVGEALGNESPCSTGSLPPGSVSDTDHESSVHYAVLLEFVEGITLEDCQHPPSDLLLLDIGRFCGQLQNAMQATPADVVEVVKEHPVDEWNLVWLPTLREDIGLVDSSDELKDTFHTVIDMFEAVIEPLMLDERLQPGLVHADLSTSNLLTSKEESERNSVAGAIDFSDLVHSYVVCELAGCMAYCSFDCEDPVRASGLIIRGYLAVRPLAAAEQRALYILVCSQLTMLLVLSKKQLLTDPGNADYLSRGLDSAARALQVFWATGWDSVEKIWFE